LTNGVGCLITNVSTNSLLILSNVQETSSGNYAVIASDNYGSVTSTTPF